MATLKNVNLKVPETVFEIVDQSSITEVIPEKIITPVFLTAFASPKGTENPGYYTSDNFYKEFGSDFDFEKYGQAFLQADRTIKAGGKLLCKRIVAKDSTLAHIAVVAHVKKADKVQKTDEDGNLLYTNILGQETTESITDDNENTPIFIDKIGAKVRFTAHSFAPGENDTTIKTLRDAVSTIDTDQYYKAVAESENDELSFPLFVITDTGRGTSLKRFRITPNYTLSKHEQFTYYNFEVIENSKVIESFTFTLDPDILVNNINVSIQNVIRTNSHQMQCQMFDGYIKQFFEKVSDYSGNTIEYIKSNDVIFGTERKGSKIPLVNVETEYSMSEEDQGKIEEGLNLAYTYGIDLKNGTNGSFGEYPVKSEEYKNQLKSFFDGDITNIIYDLDNYKIDAILDANYPAEVKESIEKLAIFREDLMFFEDMGTGMYSLESIEENINSRSDDRFDRTVYLNHLSYDVLHPYTNKQITVTYTYSFATLLVNHFNNGRVRALAGKKYGITIPEAIEGTVNFVPMNTPKVRERDEIVELKVNYGVYYDGTLVIETEYTSQKKNSQLSYVNNVLAVQELIKKVRSKCPLIRYGFLEGRENLLKYKEDVQAVLDTVSGNFKSLTMEYYEDTTMLNNKVFYAGIVAEFKDFVQKEYFKLTTLTT